MKVIKLVLMLFCSFLFAQKNDNNFEISEYEKKNNDIKFLASKFNFGITDTLICLNKVKFISIKKDSVILYKTKNDKIIFKKIYSKEDMKDKIEIKFLFELNPIELTIERQDGVKIDVKDGSDYSIEIYKSDKCLELISYSPQTYIDNKFPFYEKRKLFLDCFNKLDSLFIDDFFLKVQKAEEVFIKFEVTDYTSKKTIKNNGIIDGKEIYYINELVFSSINNTNKKVNLKTINQKLVVDYLFLNQYFSQELKKMLKENGKKIFMIEKCNNSKNKFIINQVKVN